MQPMPKVTYQALVGKTLASERERRKILQTTVAAELGVTQSAYSKLESGASALNASQIHLATRALGMTAADLMTRVAKNEERLKAEGVDVVHTKEDNSAAVIIGLGLLAALLFGKA